MVNVQHYTYRVIWSQEDQEFVGLCTEFPSLSFLDEDQEAALDGIVNLVAIVVEGMRGNDENIPTPSAEKKYSGKFVVRVTSEEHRRLAVSEAEQKISLNKLAASNLAECR